MESEINLNSIGDKNVDVVITKYKLAAAFLWTLLHAQGCRLPASECPIKGCADTKRLLVHVMSCTACPGHACPMSYSGCHQARKLIGHYRECRKKQRSQRNRGRKSQCLLCTLLGRHKPVKIVQNKTPHTKDQCTECDIKGSELIDNNVALCKDMESMPPPPPRPRIASVGSIHQVSPISLCTLSLSENSNNKQQDNLNSLTCRARSVSLDGRKINVKSSKLKMDPTDESRLVNQSGRSEEIKSCELTAVNPALLHKGRRRSMSCSNMSSSNRCETILEETQPDGNHL